MSRFKEITLSGSPQAIGQQHGAALAGEIREALRYYRSIFNLSESTLLALGRTYLGLISDYYRPFAEEIKGIAQGCEMDPRWIAVLNARTEILSHTQAAAPMECTTIFSRPTALLAQNWDWSERLESLVVVMKIVRPDGQVIRMLTEPGILGKIGMNSSGLGVCLNILTVNQPLKGLPIHIVLRAILQADTLAAAREVIDHVGAGKASSILVGTASGEGFNAEFAGQNMQYVKSDDDIWIHTNHYLHRVINQPDDPDFASSYAREKTTRSRLSSTVSLDKEQMISILSDRSNRELQVLRPYQPDDKLQSLGTVCTIIMDLPARKLWIRKGNQPDGEFVCYSARKERLA